MTSAPTFSKHAERQWARRYSGHDLGQVFAAAERPTKGQRRALRAQLPRRARAGFIGKGRIRGQYYLVHRELRIVFVVAEPQFVITVFPLTGNTHWLATRLQDLCAELASDQSLEQPAQPALMETSDG